MSSEDRTLTRGWALMLCTSVALSFDCGGLEPLPPHVPMPSPGGEPVAFGCPRVDAAAPAHGAPAPIAFDASLSGWTRADAFQQPGQPLRRPVIRAADARPRWSREQMGLLSGREKDRSRSPVPIGGDYWRDTPYWIGPMGDSLWVSSGFETDPGGTLPRTATAKPTGTMTSSAFTLGRSLRVAIGGDDDPGVGIALLVKPEKGRDLSRCEEQVGAAKIGAFADGFVPVLIRHRPLPTESDARAPAWEKEHLDWVLLPAEEGDCKLTGLQAELRIFDMSETAHVNVGAIEWDDSAPARWADSKPVDRAPVWGFADLHTHPTDYLGFGGLQGLHAVWGAPGGDMHDYVGDPAKVASSFSRDLPPCDDAHMPFNAHHGGYAAPAAINGAEGRMSPSVDDLAVPAFADLHGNQGAPTFADAPYFQSGAHEQYHISEIHRAYLGGLRFMSALAVHNPAFEYGMGWVRCSDDGKPTVDTTPDWTIIRAHVRAMKQLAELNDDWMGIAYSPADARRLIRANKLAVILGVEVPQLGQTEDGKVEDQVNELERLGIRQVILVHGMNNMLASSAVFQDLYNTVNDFLYREERDKVYTLSGLLDWAQPQSSFKEALFEITTAPSPRPSSLPASEPMEETEPILFRLGTPVRTVLSDVFPRPGPYTYRIPFMPETFGPLHTLISATPVLQTEQGKYDQYASGHRNARGLTGRGAEFILRLMQHGMLVDLAHMSDATLASVYDLTGRACGSYPLMVSHAHFRSLPLKADYSDRVPDLVTRTGDAVRQDLLNHVHPMNRCVRDPSTCNPLVLAEATRVSQQAPQLGPGTVNRESLPREFDIASSEVQQIRVRDGSFGVFLGQGPLDTNAFMPAARNLPGGLAKLPLALDCAGTSKDLAATLLFANARMKGRGILAVASDFTLVGNAGPRFGDNACSAYLGAGMSSSSAAQLLETLLDPAQYKMSDQTDAIVYADGTATTCAGGKRTWGEPACGSNEPLEPSTVGQRTYDFNVDGLAHYGLVPDMLQDVANVLHGDRGLALDGVFASASGMIEMWDRARVLSGCEASGMCADAPPRGEDPQCKGEDVRAECGSECPCAWNHGAPLQEVLEAQAVCDPGKTIRFPIRDDRGQPTFARPVYMQRRTDPLVAGDLTEQGDWAVFPIRAPQTWRCGHGEPQSLGCPAGANYVKVRRVLDTTVSPIIERCDYQPLPPEAGNRRLVFQCLVGPPERPWKASK